MKNRKPTTQQILSYLGVELPSNWIMEHLDNEPLASRRRLFVLIYCRQLVTETGTNPQPDDEKQALEAWETFLDS
jgi:hypothetical protein